MADLPVKYRKAGDAIVSVGITELGTGLNLVDLYVGTASGANIISSVPFYSNDIMVNTVSKHWFYLDFNNTQTIEGRAIFQIPCVAVADGSGGDTKMEFGVGISGALGYTDLATGTVESFIGLSANQKVAAMRTTALYIPRTTFKKGDKFVFFTDGFENGAMWIGVDPKARQGGQITAIDSDMISGAKVVSSLVIQTPFKIDV